MGKTMPTYKGESQYLEEAKIALENLSEKNIKKLRKLTRYSSDIACIDEEILPFMYDNGLFTGSDHWIDGLEWLERDTEDRVERLDLDNTLILLTSALAKDDNKGADYWYYKGITTRLLKHLTELRDKAGTGPALCV